MGASESASSAPPQQQTQRPPATSSYPGESSAAQNQSSLQRSSPPPQSQPATVRTSITSLPNGPQLGSNGVGPGAYRVTGRGPSAPRRFTVTIPPGIRPGDHFTVFVEGQPMQVRCPPDVRPGDRVMLNVPTAQQQQSYIVTVPENVRSGQQFPVLINNQQVLVTCPPNVTPGSRVTFQLPREPAQVQPAANHQMFEVTVPDGVRPGQPFALLANAQRVMVTCPMNVHPGQKIRFQLPIQLTNDQLKTFSLSYDKDGWMRCLDPDLKFRWFFSQSQGRLENKDNDDDLPGAEKKDDVREALDKIGLVRSLIRSGDKTVDIDLVPASDYRIESNVEGTSVNYAEINRVGKLPFEQKADWLKKQFMAMRVSWDVGYIRINVRRDNLLMDTVEAFNCLEAADFHKSFRYEFIGEPGLDAGGISREFYTIASEQMFNPAIGLFQYSSQNQMCTQVNPNSGIANELHLQYFFVAGRLIGKALSDGHLVKCHLVQPLYKHLLGWPLTFDDIEHLDPETHANLLKLTSMTADDLSSLDLDFTVTEERMGICETVLLANDSANKTVTRENVLNFLECQLKYKLLTRVKDQLKEFLRGFYDVIPEAILSIMDFQELELILCGLPNIDMEDWFNNTEYVGEFERKKGNHEVVKWFWEVLRGFPQDQKARFLQFATGTAGVPVQGFSYLQGNDGNIRRFTLNGTPRSQIIFPRSHTCFNRVDLPVYKNKEELQKYVTLAIQMEATGFDIE